MDITGTTAQMQMIEQLMLQQQAAMAALSQSIVSGQSAVQLVDSSRTVPVVTGGPGSQLDLSV